MRRTEVRLVVLDGCATLVGGGYEARRQRRSARLLVLCVLALALGLLVGGAALGRDRATAVTGSGDASFTRISIDQGDCAQTLRANGTGDVNGDGRIDFITAGDSGVYWFDNPDWGCHVIATGQYGEGSTIVTRDVNGDGAMDVITGNRLTRQMLWFENRGGGDWAPHVLSSTAYCHNISIANVNGDGRPDIGCTDPDHATISWLEAPADPSSAWTQHVIDTGRPAWGAVFADIDGDGRIDLVAGRAWYRNTGVDHWPRYAYTDRADTARPNEPWNGAHFSDYEYLSVLDLNHDGRLDIVATLFAGTPEGEVWAFLAPSNPLTEPWRRVRIDDGTVFSVHSQAVADFDGSGRVQVLVGEMQIGGYGFGPTPDPRLLVYRLDGDPAQASGWTRLVIDHAGTHEATAVDIDGDGRVDVAGGDENSDLDTPPRTGWVRWWRNTEAAAPPPTTTTSSTAATTTAPTPSTTTSPPTTTDVAAARIDFVGVGDGQTVSGTVTWEATVSAASAVKEVTFRVDGADRWVERAVPYQFDATGRWDTTGIADGVHTLGLVALLADGTIVSSSIEVTVQNAVTPARPVEFDSGASFGVYGKGDSQPVTVPDLDGGLLLFEFAGKTGADQVTSVTYGGLPLTRFAAIGQASARAEIWYLVDPPAGRARLVWNKTGAAQNVTWGVSVYGGVDGAEPFDATARASARQDVAATPKQVTVAARADELVVGLAAFNGSPRVTTGPTPADGQTSRWSEAQSTTAGDSSTGVPVAGAETVTLAWTPGGSPNWDWALLAVALRPAG